MKILQIIPYLGLGGAEIMCENLTEVLIRQDHQVVVVSLYTKETPITARLLSKSVKVVFLGKKVGLDVSVVSKLAEFISIEHPDAIHTHLASLKYVYAAIKRIKMEIPIIHTVHSIATQESPKLDRILNRWLFRKRIAIPVALSEEIRKTILTEYGLEADSVNVIYNGIQLSKCIPKQIYKAGTKFTIIHVGRFYEVKNHISLLHAFREIHSRYPECQLVMIGEGEKKAEMEAVAIELGLKDAVAFLGQQANVFPFLHDADIFVLPSLYEGVPISVVEAMGTGLPIVASRVGGIPDMICDNREGILCQPDAQSIASAIERMYRSQALRESCGKAAIEASKRFSANTMADRYTQLYQWGRIVSEGYANESIT